VKLAIAAVAGVALGAIAVEGLHAQAKATQIYVVAEIDVRNLDAYQKDYAPKAQALNQELGRQAARCGPECA
jgi:hypothetical protein